MKNPTIILLSILALAGCGAGSGEGLDDNGDPVAATPVPTQAPGATPTPTPAPVDGVTLAQIQTQIFDDPCAICHTGNSAPQGLRLDSEDNSYNMLVGADGEGVPANEVPERLRVNPGSPDESYLVHKLEGGPDIVGGQMPLNMAPLSQEQIDMVRDWIANGAPREGTGNTATAISKTRVSNKNTIVNFQLRFSRAVQVETLTEGAVQVYFRHNATERLASPTEYQVAVAGQLLTVQINRPVDPADAFVVLVNDPALASVLDSQGRAIDGDNDNVDGGAYRYVHSF